MGASHLDRIGRLDRPAALGCSNPGRFENRPGGTALNICRNLGTLGRPAELVTMLGDDDAGQWLMKIITKENIALTVIPSVNSHTGSYTSIMEPNGSVVVALADMAIIDEFSADQTTNNLRTMKNDDWLCIDANLPEKELQPLLDRCRARKVGLTVSKAKAGRLRQVLSSLDILFTNKVEACALLGLEEPANTVSILNALAAADVKAAVITDGPAPVLVIQGGVHTELPVDNVDRILDVTGAGDSLVATTLFYFTNGAPLVQSTEKGIKAAHATIQAHGAIRSDLADHLN